MQWQFRNRATVFACILLALTTATAWPQSGQTIRLILPFPPGGPADAMARLVAEQVGASGGPTMVVESHPGAGTEIGTEYVFRSDSDGNTLGIISNSFVVLPLIRKLSYDPFTDFTPICELASFPPLIVVNGDSPYHTLADLINAAHAQPGVLTLGTIGPATSTQLAFEMLKYKAKANITFVPFAGYTPAVQALLGQQITAAMADLSTLQGQIQTGKLRALATTARTRVASLPNVPTVAESGYDVKQEFFGGVVAPAKTPKETIARLTDVFKTALQAPNIKAKFASLGFFAGGECGADYAAILRKDYADYGQIIRDANLKMQ
ncbi:MAG: tripartite tricarboxylate transporter substrate binding protein [Xanthobacteraceae bacterium]|jgi:tripartite-type tricarboxylate transporter receptor subunit TctC